MTWPVPFWNEGTEAPDLGGDGTPNPCGTPGSDLGKLEGQLVVPNGTGYRMTVNGTTVTVLTAGGGYWPTSTTSFLTSIKVVLTAMFGGTWTATVSDGDTGTGKVTLTWSGGVFTVAWIDTALRDALGFTIDLSGAATYTGASATPYVWLPNRRRWLPPTPEGYKGLPVVDTTTTVSSSGHVRSLYTARRYVTRLWFRYLSGAKTWRVFESVTNESLQTFWETTIGAGLPVRYHHDRSDDATYNEWHVAPVFAVAPDVEGYVGRGCSGANSYWSWGPVDVQENVTT